MALIVNTVGETKEQSVLANSVRRIQHLWSTDFSFPTNYWMDYLVSRVAITFVRQLLLRVHGTRDENRSIDRRGISAVLLLFNRRTADFQTYRAQLLFNRDLKSLSDVSTRNIDEEREIYEHPVSCLLFFFSSAIRNKNTRYMRVCRIFDDPSLLFFFDKLRT